MTASRSNIPRETRHRARARPAQLLPAERRRAWRSSARDPRECRAPGETSTCTSCPSAASPSATARDVDGSANRARHGLIDGGVQDAHRSLMAVNPSRASAKNGPEVIRPNRSKSSFIAADSMRERRRWSGSLAICCFAALRASRIASRSASSAETRPDSRLRRPARHRAFGHAHDDVLDEAADDRRVEADPRDPEAGSRGHLLELGHVTQRVQVVGLAQPLLAHVDQPQPLELTRQAVDPSQAERQSARSSGRASRRTRLRPAPARARLRLSMPRSASGERCSRTSSE